MLTESQAREIVHASIKETSKKAVSSKEDRLKLEDLGITNDEKLQSLVINIASSPKLGVPRFEHYIDSNFIGDLNPATTIGALTAKVLELSAGKMCSNPRNPHAQKCCPYPARCPQCGYLV